MGFSVKIAPGVRVRASSRGVRTSIGPRAARIHVGGGRAGISTGAGPVSYYTSFGGARRPRSSGGGGSAAAARRLAAAQARADKASQAQELARALTAILELHRAEFPAAQRPIAPPPPAPDITAIHRQHRREARRSTSVFKRKARRGALARARVSADAEVVETARAWEAERAAWQSRLDREWAALNANHPPTVLAALAAAFEDNEAAASAVGVDGSHATLVVIVPSSTAVPDRRPMTTQAGNLSLKKLTKTEAAGMYTQLVCGHLVVTLKEAFAVAPGLESATVIAVRSSDPDAYGTRMPEALIVAVVERARLAGIRWQEADAVRVLRDASSHLLMTLKGVTQALQPVDLTADVEIAAVLAAVTFEQ